MTTWIGLALSPSLNRQGRSRFARAELARQLPDGFVPQATSFSYCGDIVGFAASGTQAVGIDIEVVNKHALENARLACPEIDSKDPVEALRAWCAKEALVKYRGTGFQDEPSRYPVHREQSGIWRGDTMDHTISVLPINAFGVHILLAICQNAESENFQAPQITVGQTLRWQSVIHQPA